MDENTSPVRPRQVPFNPSRRPPIYRKVCVRVHGDDKYRKLTPVLPSGQSLWLWLLVTDESTAMPGLMKLGKAGAAEELGWSVAAFAKHFAELEAQGMALADWDARVIWLPNALKHNLPDNPSIVKGWDYSFDMIPECPLKHRAWVKLLAELEQVAGSWKGQTLETYVSWFRDWFPEPGGARQQTLPDTVSDTLSDTVSQTVPDIGTVSGTGTGTVSGTGTGKKDVRRKAAEPLISQDSIFESYWADESFERHGWGKTSASAEWLRFHEWYQGNGGDYAGYPHRIARKVTFQQWLKHKPPFARSKQAVDEQRAILEEQTGHSRLHPKTWINQHRWEDEKPTAKKGGKMSAFEAFKALEAESE